MNRASACCYWVTADKSFMQGSLPHTSSGKYIHSSTGTKIQIDMTWTCIFLTNDTLYSTTLPGLKQGIVNGNRNWFVVFLSRVHSTVLAPFALSKNSIINSLNRFWVATGETPPLWFFISCYQELERRQNTWFTVIPQAETQRERQGWRWGKAPPESSSCRQNDTHVNLNVKHVHARVYTQTRFAHTPWCYAPVMKQLQSVFSETELRRLSV